MTTIRIVLADDHALLRAGVRALLADLPEVEVVGEAADGEQALALALQTRPDVVVADISMPRLNGLELTAELARALPTARVLILSMHADRAYALRALRSGAAGYLVKDAGTAELELALRAVARGENYLSPAVSTHLVADLARRAQEDSSDDDPLTARQKEVLRLIVEGHSTKRVAGLLDISVKTVEAHRTQIMERLGIHDVPGLVRYALRHGLIADES